MSTISGFLADAGLQPFQGRWPSLRFHLSEPAAGDTFVVTRAPVEAVVNATTGAFTIEVVSTDELLPASVTYSVTADWDTGASRDVFSRLKVPSGDWNLSDLLIASQQVTAGMVMYGFGPPPANLTGVLYIDLLTADIYGPDNGGI